MILYSFVLIFLALFLYWGDKFHRTPNWDESSYLLEGSNIRIHFNESLAKGLHYIWFGDPLGRPPLYAVILSMFVHPTISWYRSVHIVNSFFFISIAVSVISLSSKRLKSINRLLLLGITMTAPFIFQYSNYVLVDIPMASAVLISLACLDKYFNTSKRHFYWVSVLFGGVAFLLKPTAYYFLAFGVTALYLVEYSKSQKQLQFLQSRKSTTLRNVILWFSFSISFISIWAIPNLGRLYHYLTIQFSFPKDEYVSADPHAGSVLGTIIYFSQLIKLYSVSILTILIISTFFALLYVKRLHLVNIQINYLPSLASALAISAIPFSLSPLWEYRYTVISAIGLSILILIFYEKCFPHKYIIFFSTFVLLISLSFNSLTLFGNMDPQKWSRNLQILFYGNPNKTKVTNFFMNRISFGKEPRLSEDRVFDFFSKNKDVFTSNKEIVIGIPFSHPELNQNAIAWETQILHMNNVSAQYITGGTVVKRKIKQNTDNSILLQLSKVNYIALPETQFAKSNYRDPVDWQNHNLFDVWRVKNLLQKRYHLKLVTSGFFSVALASAHEETIKIDFYKLLT